MTDDILKTAIARKPFNEARRAAAMVRDVVAKSVRNGFEPHCPIWLSDEEYYSPKQAWIRTAFQASSMLSPVALAFSLMAGLGGILPAAIALPAVFGAIPFGIFAQFRVWRQEDPDKQFAFADGKLASAIKKLPQGEAKDQLELFRGKAQDAFAHARISCVQKELARGDGSTKSLAKLYKNGLRFIDKSSRDLNWSSAQRKRLRDEFRKGVLPKPDEYIGILNQESVLVNRALGRAMSSERTP